MADDEAAIPNSRFQIGRALILFAGAFPFTVGLFQYSRLWMDIQIKEYFLGLISPGAEHVPFPDHLGSGGVIYSLSIIAFVNLVVTGACVLTMAYFELPKRSRVAWGLILFCALWSAGNDAVASLWFYRHGGGFPPLPFFPLVFGLLGLALTYPVVFRK